MEWLTNPEIWVAFLTDGPGNRSGYRQHHLHFDFGESSTQASAEPRPFLRSGDASHGYADFAVVVDYLVMQLTNDLLRSFEQGISGRDRSCSSVACS